MRSIFVFTAISLTLACLGCGETATDSGDLKTSGADTSAPSSGTDTSETAEAEDTLLDEADAAETLPNDGDAPSDGVDAVEPDDLIAG